MKIQGYHASDRKFDRPCTMESKFRRDLDSSRHVNGSLGIWVTTDPNEKSKDAYGKYLYEFEVDLKPDQVGTYGISQLRSLSSFAETKTDAEFAHLQLRDQWLSLGLKFINLLEHDGKSKLGIILDNRVISRWELIKIKD